MEKKNLFKIQKNLKNSTCLKFSKTKSQKATFMLHFFLQKVSFFFFSWYLSYAFIMLQLLRFHIKDSKLFLFLQSKSIHYNVIILTILIFKTLNIWLFFLNWKLKGYKMHSSLCLKSIYSYKCMCYMLHSCIIYDFWVGFFLNSFFFCNI